jgi:type IV pilus assembly protein PilC
MVYPAIVVTFAVAVLLALVAFLIPVFVGVFKQFPGKLPALTRFITTALSRPHDRPASRALNPVFAWRR